MGKMAGSLFRVFGFDVGVIFGSSPDGAEDRLGVVSIPIYKLEPVDLVGISLVTLSNLTVCLCMISSTSIRPSPSLPEALK